MDIFNFLFCILLILFPFTVAAQDSPQADSADSIQVLKISPQEERAVIKTPDRKMHMIKVGDSIGDTGKIIEITNGRVVMEEKTGNGIETVIFRLEDGKQRVERIRKVPGEQPQLYAPK